MALVLLDTIQPRIGRIVLNDPENLNAMSEEMADEFSKVVERIKNDERSYRVLLLTGAGRAFSAGGNLEMLERKQELPPDENRLRMLKFYHSFLGLFALSIPTIAVINGHAIGAGLCVAAACDIRVAAAGAKLGFTFAKLGLHPGMGATYFLPRVIGDATARELLMTGRIIDAETALRRGLISQCVPAEELSSVGLAIAQEIVQCGPEAIRQLTESLRSPQRDLEASLEREALCQSVNYATAEFKEGVRATIEKRKPNF